jgi:drug/metabolite transporter (DMT)-like permease
MEVPLALAAALLFALGTVLEEEVASQASEAEARGAGFLLALARRPRWLAGTAADVLGFVAQAGALAVGRLVVVQPLLATSVVFALPLGAKLGGRRISGREVLAACTVTAGLAGFLVAADPGGGVENPGTTAWIVAIAVCFAVAGALTLTARGRSPTQRATMLGTAAGVLYGLSAALIKATVDVLDEGVLEVFTDWHLYALLGALYASMSLSQAALQTGALAPAVATVTSVDPITSVLLGTLAFQETIHETVAGNVLALAAFAVMLAGLVYLALHRQTPEAANVPG